VNPNRSVGPAIEPISLAEAKQWLREDGTDQDEIISILITGAREFVEEAIGKTLIQSTWIYTLDTWSDATVVRAAGQWPNWNTRSDGNIRLPYSPLISVTSVKYYDTAGTLQTLDAADYQVDTANVPGRIMPAVNRSWPDLQPDKAGAVIIEYKGGYGTGPLNVPNTLRLAVLYLISLWYDERKPIAFSISSLGELPLTVSRLIGPPVYG